MPQSNGKYPTADEITKLATGERKSHVNGIVKRPMARILRANRQDPSGRVAGEQRERPQGG